MPRRYWPLGWWVLLLVACASTRAPECGNAPQDASCTRVLFIGNSYTGVNDLPSRFKAIAASGRHAVYTEMIAPGGLRLADHAASLPVLEKIRSGRWNYVVLQEQSQIPSVEQARQGQMFPAPRVLVNEIRRAGVPGHRGGTACARGTRRRRMGHRGGGASGNSSLAE